MTVSKTQSSFALFDVGFRPLFVLAIVAGALLPPLWALAFAGRLPLTTSHLSTLQWHAHEMLFGFGWAVLGGFLLTASRNWLHIRGLHGGALAFVSALWVVERFVMIYGDAIPRPLWWLLVNAYIVCAGGYVAYTLVRYRKQDSFSDNMFFIVALPLFVVAKNLILLPEAFAAGSAMGIGLFRVAFAVMFERTITQFMRKATGIEILRNRYLDGAIKVLVLASAFQGFMPVGSAAVLLLASSVLLAVRFAFWKPVAAFHHFGIAVMYVGYAALALHFALEAFKVLGIFSGLGSLSTHVFTFLCMGVVIPAMMVRICQGHTGRKIVFTASDRAAIGLMGLASFFRLFATQLWPSSYSLWIELAGLGWTLCFSIIGIRLIPFLWRARVDAPT